MRLIGRRAADVIPVVDKRAGPHRSHPYLDSLGLASRRRYVGGEKKILGFGQTERDESKSKIVASFSFIMPVTTAVILHIFGLISGSHWSTKQDRLDAQFSQSHPAWEGQPELA